MSNCSYCKISLIEVDKHLNSEGLKKNVSEYHLQITLRSKNNIRNAIKKFSTNQTILNGYKIYVEKCKGLYVKKSSYSKSKSFYELLENKNCPFWLVAREDLDDKEYQIIRELVYGKERKSKIRGKRGRNIRHRNPRRR